MTFQQTSPPVARYFVIIERDVVEGDYSRPYGTDSQGNGTGTDGTYRSTVEQLAAELQEGWDAAGIGGFFHVVGREVVPCFSDLSDVPVPDAEWHGGWPHESNPEPYLWPAPPVKAPGLTPLPISYWGGLKPPAPVLSRDARELALWEGGAAKRPDCTGFPDDNGDNFHNGDTCPICEDEDSPWYEG